MHMCSVFFEFFLHFIKGIKIPPPIIINNIIGHYCYILYPITLKPQKIIDNTQNVS